MAHAELVIWDVQHGNAIYLKTPNGKHIVIDLGVGSYGHHGQGFSPLLHLRDNYGVKQIDFVIITHPHKDHIEDMLNFKILNPKVFRRPQNITREDVLPAVLEKDRPIFEEYFRIHESYNSPIDENDPINPSKPENLGGLSIQTFKISNLPKSNLNNLSILTVVTLEGIKIVLPGDNEIQSLDELMKQDDFKSAVKDADVLLAPHHARESAFHPEFVKHVNPRIVAVSDGSYADTSAIDRYRAYARGWGVHSNGVRTNRYTLSTYNEGVIVVHFGASTSPGFKNFLYVKTVK